MVSLYNLKALCFVFFPYLLQLTFSVYHIESYPIATFTYATFFIAFVFFIVCFQKVNVNFYVCATRKKYEIIFKYLLITLFVLKIFLIIKIFSSGIDYTKIRDFYFNSDERFEMLYLNSQLLMKLMTFLYPTLLYLFFLISLFKKKHVFFWGGLFLIDGIITGGRFNIYIFIVSIFLMYRPPLYKLLYIVPVLFMSIIIQLFRGDNTSSGIKSIIDYHVAPIAIFSDSISVYFPSNIFGGVFFSGLVYYFEPLIPGDATWLKIQLFLKDHWVLLVDSDNVYNAFGNVFLFSFWEFLYIGPVVVAFFYALFSCLSFKKNNEGIIFFTWVVNMIYFSSMQMKIFSPDLVVFIVIYFLIFNVRIGKCN